MIDATTYTEITPEYRAWVQEQRQALEGRRAHLEDTIRGMETALERAREALADFDLEHDGE